MKNAYDIINDPFLNKGTAFSAEERELFKLNGMIPDKIQTIEEQAAQAYQAMSMKTNDVDKRHFLMKVFSHNRTLFYYLFSQHVEDFFRLYMTHVLPIRFAITANIIRLRRIPPFYRLITRKIWKTL